MTIGSKSNNEDPVQSMAKRLKQDSDVTDGNSPTQMDMSKHNQVQEETRDNTKTEEPTRMNKPDDDSDEEPNIYVQAALAASTHMPDMNKVEFHRTPSDDEPIDPEPVPLSDSELPPRPRKHKKKKSKKSKDRSRERQNQSNTDVPTDQSSAMDISSNSNSMQT